MNFTSSRIAKVLALVALSSLSGLASAADSSTLAVSATVKGVCKFSAASTPLAFADIDPSATTNAVITANLLYRCTKNTAGAAITTSDGVLATRTMTAGGGQTLPYSLSFGSAPGVGNGFGAAVQTIVVTGTITVAQFQGAEAATYSENVSLSITP